VDEKLHIKLSERQEKGTMRSLSSFDGYVDFFSNDYLGIGKAQKNFNSFAGSTGSRLLSGNSKEHEQAESEIANFFGSESALHFNAGYDANLGIFSAIPQKGDTILYDELIHASTRDGIRLSWANSYSFRHNDLEHLRKRLQQSQGAVYIAVEALYSMDGDCVPLVDLIALAKEFGAYIIMDEAHSGGVFGPEGRGYVSEFGLEDAIFIRLMTFGKAYGSHGAIVLCSQDVRNYLINFCRPFIYSTALPSYVLKYNASVVKSVEIEKRKKTLQEKIAYFRENIGVELISDESSPIQIVEYGDIAKTKSVSEKLQKKGIAVKPIFSPAVQEGKERIRICIHAYNTKQEIDVLIKELQTS